MNKARKNIAKAYIDQHLGDQDILEHITAIREDVKERDLAGLYICVGDRSSIELRRKEYELGDRDVVRLYDMGFSLAQESTNPLLFAVYLISKKQEQSIVSCLIADGRSRAFLLREDDHLELEQVPHMDLLTSFLEGFFVGYRQREGGRRKTKKHKIIIPGENARPSSGGKIIIP
jgi:hypothetical protein